VAYAEVSVNAPLAQRQTFSYSIPAGLAVTPGQAVWVPFGDKQLQGIVIELTDLPAVAETKDIAGVIDDHPVLSPEQVTLARFISDYYLSPLFDAVGLMLPPGFERKPLTFVAINPDYNSSQLSSISPELRDAFELIQKQGRTGLRQLEKTLGKKKAQTAVSQLVRRGLAVRSYELEAVKIRPKTELYISLKTSTGEARQEAVSLRQKRAGKQADLLDFLTQQDEPVSWAETRQQTKVTRATAAAVAACC